MKIIATLLIAVILAGLVTSKLLNYPLEEPSQWMVMQKNKERLENYQQFKQTMNETLTRLEKGECNMQDAQGQVCAAARRYNPAYLISLQKTDSGTTDDRRVANNLLGHLRTIIPFRPNVVSRIQDLEIELMQQKSKSGR